MSSRIKNDFELSLARLRRAIAHGNALNRQALGRARKALSLIRSVRAWESRFELRLFPGCGEALRAAERGLATFLLDATAVLDGARDGGKEPERCQRSTTRGGGARRDR